MSLVVTCNLGTVAVGGSVTLAVGAVVNKAGALSNTATVTSTTSDPNTADNTATATTTVLPSADLALTMVGDRSPAVVYEGVKYTMVVRNHGPDPATSVGLSDLLPSSAWYLGATTSQGTCTLVTGYVNCNLGTVPAGATVTVTVTLAGSAVGDMVNYASLTSPTYDPNFWNSRASVATKVVAVSGGAFGQQVTVTSLWGVPLRLGPSPSVTLPSWGGGPFTASSHGAYLSSLIDTGNTVVSTHGQRRSDGYLVTSSADVSYSTLGLAVYATDVHTDCRATEGGSEATTSMSYLEVNGEEIRLEGPNQVVPVDGVGWLYIDEQVPLRGGVVVRGLRLRLSGSFLGDGDIVVAESRCAIG